MFQKVLDELRQQGVLNNTYVIFTSDHGELLGDHDMQGKNTYHQSSASVPLIISGPDVPPGLEIEYPISNLDISGTVLELAGVPLDSQMETRSLRSFWHRSDQESEAPEYRDVVFVGLSQWRMVVKHIDGFIYKFVRCYEECRLPPVGGNPLTNDTGTTTLAPTKWISMLYNVTGDPYDLHDISKDRPDLSVMLCLLLPQSVNLDNLTLDFTSECASLSLPGERGGVIDSIP